MADYYSVPRSLINGDSINGWSYNSSDVRGGHVTATEAIYHIPPALDALGHDYDDCFPELDMEGYDDSEC